MTREIFEKEKEKVIAGVNKLCEKILSCENDKAKQEDLIEEFCFLADLVHVPTDPSLLSYITLDRIKKCLDLLKPELGFRICQPDNDYFDFSIKKNRKVVDIKLGDNNNIFVSFDGGNKDGSFYGFRQFIYYLGDFCGIEIGGQFVDDFLKN